MVLNLSMAMGGEHSSHMFIFFLNLTVGLEIVPPVQRGSSLPVQYIIPGNRGIKQ